MRRDVDALTEVLAAAEKAAPFDFDAVGWKQRHHHQAQSLLESDWYAAHEAQVRDLLEERDDLLAEVRRLALAAVRDADVIALTEALTREPNP